MKAYKGFDKELKCRGYQFKVGESYQESEANLCKNGFHACENPLDTLNYYDVIDGRFAEVELDEVSSETEDKDTKRVGKKIYIKAELSIKDLIKFGVEFMMVEAKKKSSGDYAQLAASGDYAQLAASGYSAKLAASGDSAKLAASGDYAQLAASGDYAKLAASGYYAQLAASGYSAKLAASGENSVLMCAGPYSIAKAKKGSWITLSEWENGKPICVKTRKVDGKHIKQDVFYKLKGGMFIEVTE